MPDNKNWESNILTGAYASVRILLSQFLLSGIFRHRSLLVAHEVYKVTNHLGALRLEMRPISTYLLLLSCFSQISRHFVSGSCEKVTCAVHASHEKHHRKNWAPRLKII